VSRLLLVLALAAASAASAAERRPPREADLGKKKQVTPDASLAGKLEPAVRKPEELGPTLEFETFRYRVELQVSGKRREEIADLRKLIQLGGAPGEMPGWLFRLAELYWEESQYFFFEANRKDDELTRLGPKPDPAQAARIQAERKDLEGRSRSWQAEAVGQYKDIVKRYPKYQRLDEVLFFLGENLWKQRQQEEALSAYRLLITRFPKSRYVPDAWMAFGEYYFNSAEKAKRNENLKKALGSYERAASFTESTVYGYAMYKQAWVHYNLGAWSKALDLFRAVIFFGDLPTTTIAVEKKLALVREARKDYVRTYSHVGSPEGAMDEFRRVGGDPGWIDMLKALADLYFSEGKDREAILVYHQLIKQKPAAPEAPLFQARIVTSAGRMGRKDLAVQQARVFARMLREVEQSKEAQDEKGRRQIEEARKAAENTLRTLAVQYHTEYRKTRDEPVAAMAAEVYQDYLALFPTSPQAYDLRFFHAELLFALEKYQAAGDEYTRVADVDSARLARKEKAGKYLADSLENAVHAYDDVAKRFEETEKRQPADPKQRLPIPKPKQQLLDACQRYLKWAPKGDKYVNVAYKAAQIHYRYNWFAEATNLFTEIALDHPRHEVSGYATNLVLDAYNLLGDWRNVNGWARRFYQNQELLKAHPQLRDDLVKIIEQSSFKVIEEYQREKSHRKAADAYLAFVRDWPGSRLAPTALYNASVEWANARQLDRAVEVRDQLVSRFPADSLAAKSIYLNAADYEAIAEFEKAAAYYERYFSEWQRSRLAAAPKAKGRKARAKGPPPAPAAPGLWEEQKAQDSIYNAGVLREGLRDFRRAEADRQAYLAAWPDSKEAPRIFLSLADLYQKEKATSKELRQLEEYQRRFARDPTEWLSIQGRIARLLERAGNAPAARRAYAEALQHHRTRKGQVGDKGLPVVAQAMYLELEPEFERYDRITLDVKPKFLKSQLEVKAKRLEELQKSYTAVVNLKQAEPAVCALYRIGFAYKRLAQALYEAPIPRELKALKRQDVIDEYKGQLAQFAAAPEQKAIEGLEYAVAKSREYGVVNDCSRKAAELLQKYKPDQYGAPLEIVPEPAVPATAGPRPTHGLITALLPPEPAAGRDEVAAPALPPLSPPRREAAPRATARDPDLAEEEAPRARPPPTEKPVPIPQKGDKDKDEDLLE
jgi:tetratricopeptide (TPR) repeat protein